MLYFSPINLAYIHSPKKNKQIKSAEGRDNKNINKLMMSKKVKPINKTKS